VTLACTIPGHAVPFARPRFAGRRGYNEPGYAAWKRAAALCIRAGAGVRAFAPLEPVEVEIAVYAARPARRPAHVPVAEWRGGGVAPRIGRSDLDNVVKAVLDAAVDSGVLPDDRQVVAIVARQWYAPARGEVRVELTIIPHYDATGA
jgi:Holliday junction resolvase RusA-like endonuclease